MNIIGKNKVRQLLAGIVATAACVSGCDAQEMEAIQLEAELEADLVDRSDPSSAGGLCNFEWEETRWYQPGQTVRMHGVTPDAFPGTYFLAVEENQAADEPTLSVQTTNGSPTPFFVEREVPQNPPGTGYSTTVYFGDSPDPDFLDNICHNTFLMKPCSLPTAPVPDPGYVLSATTIDHQGELTMTPDDSSGWGGYALWNSSHYVEIYRTSCDGCSNNLGSFWSSWDDGQPVSIDLSDAYTFNGPLFGQFNYYRIKLASRNGCDSWEEHVDWVRVRRQGPADGGIGS